MFVWRIPSSLVIWAYSGHNWKRLTHSLKNVSFWISKFCCPNFFGFSLSILTSSTRRTNLITSILIQIQGNYPLFLFIYQNYFQPNLNRASLLACAQLCSQCRVLGQKNIYNIDLPLLVTIEHRIQEERKTVEEKWDFSFFPSSISNFSLHVCRHLY